MQAEWMIWIATAGLLASAFAMFWRAGKMEGVFTTRVGNVEARLGQYIDTISRLELDQRLSRVEAKVEMLSEIIMRDQARDHGNG